MFLVEIPFTNPWLQAMALVMRCGAFALTRQWSIVYGNAHTSPLYTSPLSEAGRLESSRWHWDGVQVFIGESFLSFPLRSDSLYGIIALQREKSAALPKLSKLRDLPTAV